MYEGIQVALRSVSISRFMTILETSGVYKLSLFII